MPRAAPVFRLATEGTCSFCGKSRAEVRAFVASSITTVQICDQCLGLCCSVLGDATGAKGVIADGSATDVPQDLLAEVIAALARKGLPAPREDRDFRCSFCDLRRDEVPMLISGPRVFICGACVGAAVSVVKHGAG
jgi:ATP-dependent protease Clp ATPase subunit